MKKLALVLSLAVFTWGSVSVMNSSNSFAAFPISQSATTTTVAQSEVTLQEEVAQATSATNVTTMKAEKKQNFFSKMMSKLGGGKSQLVALLLCFFLGGLGIHRFYLGYTWQGVVQLLTGGACGIWTLIDFVRIIIGSLEPKAGGYDKTL